jgi:signal transduction histidine kinase
MLSKEEFGLIIFSIAILFIIMAFGILIVLVFQKKKNQMIQKQLKLKFEFENQIANAKNEIQENTLKNVAWELHDNIGQLLSVANMQINMLSNHVDSIEFSEQLNETKTTIQNATKEVRSISKTLNSEVIQSLGFIRSIEVELERISRLKYAETKIEIDGEEQDISDSAQIIIFRIFQEFLSNTLKHALATQIHVTISFQKNRLLLKVRDNGKGFDTTMKTESSGLLNMKSRASLIQADFQLFSEPNKGTELTLIYTFQ